MKIKTLFFTSLLCSFSFSACESSSAKRYYLTVDAVSFNNCKDCPKSGYYKEGYTFKFKTEKVDDSSYYAFLNNERIEFSSYDSDYHYFEIKMPGKDSTLAISSDYYYPDVDYYVKDLLGLSFLNMDNLIQIHSVTTNPTVNPEARETVTYKSKDKEDFEDFLDVITNEPFIKVSSNLIEPGSYSTRYVIYYKTGEDSSSDISFSVINGSYICVQQFKPRFFKSKSGRKLKLLNPYERIVVKDNDEESENT